MFKDFHKFAGVLMILSVSCAGAAVPAATRHLEITPDQTEPTATTIVEPTSQATSVPEITPTPEMVPTVTVELQEEVEAGVGDNLISSNEAVEMYRDNPVFSEALNLLNNRNRPMFVNVKGEDGEWSKDYIELEDMSFEEIDGVLFGATDDGIRVRYLPEVKDWGVEQLTTDSGLITYVLSIDSMNAKMRIAENTPLRFVRSDATDTNKIVILNREELEKYLENYKPGWGMSREKYIEISNERGLALDPNFEVHSIEDIDNFNMSQLFENEFLIGFAQILFGVVNPSTEQVRAIDNYSQNNTTEDDLNILRQLPGFIEGEKLSVQTTQGEWVWGNKITIILNDWPSEGEETAGPSENDPDETQHWPKYPVTINDKEELVIVATNISPNGDVATQLAIGSLTTFLIQNGTLSQNHDVLKVDVPDYPIVFFVQIDPNDESSIMAFGPVIVPRFN